MQVIKDIKVMNPKEVAEKYEWKEIKEAHDWSMHVYNITNSSENGTAPKWVYNLRKCRNLKLTWRSNEKGNKKDFIRTALNERKLNQWL